MSIDVSGKEPAQAPSDEALIAAQRPGTIRVARVPELHVQDFFNTVGWFTAAGTAALQSGTANHPGIVRNTTAATLNSVSSMTIGAAATSVPLWSANVVAARYVVRFPDVTNVRFYAGFFDSSGVSAADFGASGMFFEYDSSVSANWRFRCRTATVGSTVTASTGPTNNAWQVLDMIRRGATAMQFYLNGVLVGTVTENVGSFACGFGHQILTRVAATRSVDVDLARFEIVSSNRAL